MVYRGRAIIGAEDPKLADALVNNLRGEMLEAQN